MSLTIVGCKYERSEIRMGVTIQQLSVFLENREGRLDEVLNVLAGNDVNIVALLSLIHIFK